MKFPSGPSSNLNCYFDVKWSTINPVQSFAMQTTIRKFIHISSYKKGFLGFGTVPIKIIGKNIGRATLSERPFVRKFPGFSSIGPEQAAGVGTKRP